MSAPPTYRFDLAETSTKTLIEPLTSAPSKTLTLVYNRPGSLAIDGLDIDEPAAHELDVDATCVLVHRNERPIWGGRVVDDNDRAQERKTGFTSKGWMEEADHRWVRQAEEAALNFLGDGKTSGQVIGELIAAMNAQTDSGGTTRSTNLGFAGYSDTQVREPVYRRGQNYGAAIRENIDVENGCDVFVDPISGKLTARAPTDYADLEGVVFGFNRPPFNLLDVKRSRGERKASRITVAGSGGLVSAVDDVEAILASGGLMHEDWLSLSDVAQSSIVTAYANAELLYRRFGVTTYTLTPNWATESAIRPFDDFELGDQVYFSADVGRLKVERQAVRVFTLTIVVDGEGNEQVTEIGLAPSS